MKNSVHIDLHILFLSCYLWQFIDSKLRKNNMHNFVNFDTINRLERIANLQSIAIP